MVNGYDLAAAGPRCHARQRPFFILLLEVSSMSKGLAASKATWLYSSGALAATVKCLRKLTWRSRGLLGYSAVSNAAALGTHVLLSVIIFSTLS